MENKSFTVEQLVHNKSFIQWVEGELNKQEARQWDTWVKEREQNRKIALKAKKKIGGFAWKDPELPDIQHEWAKVLREIIGKKQIRPRIRTIVPRRTHKNFLSTIIKAAAVLLLAALVGVSAYVYKENDLVALHTVKTAYGAKKTVSFLDGSRITLAAASEISYKKKPQNKLPKRISLRGEAFFSITPQKAKRHPKLVVETKDGTASVWGTRFTVDSYEEETRVVLEEGEVRVHTGGVGTGKQRELIMKPGQMASYSTLTTGINLKKVNPLVYTSWTSNELFFDNTPLSVLIQRIERTYGIDVKVQNPEILHKTLSGSVDFKSLDGLINAVSDVLNIHIHHTGNMLVINDNN